MLAAPTDENRGVPYRWVVCAVLFCATTINYIDRQLLGILAPTLQSGLGWSERDYGFIVASFQAAYALGLVCCGSIIDRFGSRLGLTVAVAIWSIASMAHGWAGSVLQFSAARFGLGLAEAGNFPASIKIVSEWFPRAERAFAVGIFNAGSNVGAIITPLMVPIIVGVWGWQAAFYISGLLGFVWVSAALYLLVAPPRSTGGDEEREAAATGEMRAAIGWRDIVQDRRTWGFAVAKFLTDPIWWFYLYWAPKFLSGKFEVQLDGLAAPLVVIYLVADVGSIGGGWLSSVLSKRGRPVLTARLQVMLLCAVLALGVVMVSSAPNIWYATALLGLAAAAHQGWSANLFATVSDLFPKEAVASVVGFGGMLGAVGGMLIATAAGWMLEYTGSYVTLFCICASAYLVAWFLFQALVCEEAEKRSMDVHKM